EAAEKVGAGGGSDERDVLDLVTRLVEKSLIALDAGGERYFMLETVRQYAQERLDASQDGEETRARHLAFYLEFAERARPELVGPAQGLWLSKLDLELENLLLAHAWCDRPECGADTGLRLASAMKFYWMNRGLLDLGLRVAAEALGRQQAQVRDLARCRGLFDAGQLTFQMGQYQDAQRYLDESLAIAREIDDKRAIAAVLQTLSMAAIGQRDFARARAHVDEALVMAREMGNKREIAGAVNALAMLLRVDGAPEAAEPLYVEVLTLARELGDSASIAVALLNLAMVAMYRGSGGDARGRLQQALSIAQETGSRAAGQSVLEVSSGLAALRGEWERAARFYGAAEGQGAQTGIRRDLADESFLAPLVATTRTTMGTAEFDAAEASGRATAYPEMIAEIRSWLDSVT
ncbi:MAG: tetratricopeptide repeat protein, partial [Casimicrobiaceae bacterium]